MGKMESIISNLQSGISAIMESLASKSLASHSQIVPGSSRLGQYTLYGNNEGAGFGRTTHSSVTLTDPSMGQ